MERFNGEIKFEDLVQAFDEKNHPDVKNNCYGRENLPSE